MSLTQVKQQILDAIADEGSTVDALSRATLKSKDAVRERVIQLEKLGLVHRARVSYNVCYWFKDKSAALNCVKAHKEKPAARAAVHVKLKNVDFDKRAQVVVPPSVEVQECPPFKGLGFADEPSKVVGGWSTMGVGRYMPDEGAMLRRIARKGV